MVAAATTTPMTPEQVAQAAYQAGFRGDGVWKAVAISGRESGWAPWKHNQNAATRDDSWGLMQLNTLGQQAADQTSAILRSLGYSGALSDLLDPVANLRVAYVRSASGTNWAPWGPYKGVSELQGTDAAGAQAAAQRAAARGLLGKPLALDGGGFGGSVGAGGGGGGGGTEGDHGLGGALAGAAGDVAGGVLGIPGAIGSAVAGVATGWIADLFRVLQPFAIYAVGLAFGAGLIVLGAKKAVDPTVQKRKQEAAELAPIAAAV
jgi:hypothetical protein